MNVFHIVTAVALLLVASGPPEAARGGEPGASAYRTFRNAAGRELRGRLMSVEGDKARIRLSLGKDVEVPMASLSVEDQAYIQSWDPRERLRGASSGERAGGAGLAKFMASKGYGSAGLTLEGKTLEVDVLVNGQPQTFLFDSGRVLTLMDSALADELGVEVFQDVDFGEFPMADGSVVKVLAGSTKGFSLGDASIPAFELGVVDLARIGIEAKGVVGADVLQYLEGLVDWQAMRLYLKPE